MKDLQKKYLVSVIQSLITIAILILGVFIYGKIFGPISISLNEQALRRTFETEGVGKTTVVPNVFQTEFSIIETGLTQKEAQQKGNEKLNKAVVELTSIGIPKKDIQTSGYYINPNYDITTGRKITGYSINITTTIKSNDIDKINKLLDKLTVLSINVGGISYTVENEEKYKEQARQLAVSDAKKKAEGLAKAANFKLGKIASIKEIQEPRVISLPAMKLGAAENVGAGTNIEPGSTDITSQISITYFIKD